MVLPTPGQGLHQACTRKPPWSKREHTLAISFLTLEASSPRCSAVAEHRHGADCQVPPRLCHLLAPHGQVPLSLKSVIFAHTW